MKKRNLPKGEERPVRLEAAAGREPGVSLEKVVRTDAGQRLMELIEREQLPGDVRTTLQGALTGDLTRQALLFQAMVDTWPRLQKCLGEVQRAVRKAPWQVRPCVQRGQTEPGKEAVERAELLEDSFWGTRPEATRGELSSEGMLGQLVYGYYAGHHVLETYWESVEGSVRPRAFKAVPPRFYGYPNDSEGEDRLMFNPDGGYSGYAYEDFPKHHFLVAVNGSHPGHPTVAAPLRALTGYWMAANFGLKWLLQFAQLYGVPFRWATYSDESNKGKVCQMLESIGSAGWGAFPQGTTLEFVEARKGAEQMPQKMLVEMADSQCEIFILGQSLTSDSGANGSRALGEVHAGVRQDVLEGVAEYAAEVVNRQLVPSVVELNYGKADLLPQLVPAFARAKDEKAMAERDEILLRSGVQLPRQWYYERHGIPLPEGGEEVLGGREAPPEQEKEDSEDFSEKSSKKKSESPVTTAQKPVASSTVE